MSLRMSSSVCWKCRVQSSVLGKTRRNIPVSTVLATRISASQRNASTAASSKPRPSNVGRNSAPPPQARPGQPSTGPPKAGPLSAPKSIAQELRDLAPSFTETYVAYGVCEELVKECIRVADYAIPQASNLEVDIPRNDKDEDVGVPVAESWWYKNLGMTPTFNTWAQITFLHMYLLMVRLRCFPPEHAPTWQQHLTDHFFSIAEDRMVLLHRLNSRMVRSKYLKDLFVQWRGLTAAYDEGLMKGDAVLAAAVWRNVCKGDENVDLEKLAQIVSYIRSVLAGFDKMSDEVLAKGDIVFGDPSDEAGIVGTLSKPTAGGSKPEFGRTAPRLQ